MIYNERRARLLLKMYKDDARERLSQIERELNRRDPDLKRIARTLSYSVIPILEKLVGCRSELREIKAKKEKIKKEAMFNLYPGGNLYTTEW